MKITTYNANSVRSRIDHVLAFLETNQPDVLALQETKAKDEDFPESAFTDAGWHAVYRGEKSYNGVAMITREPVEDVQFGLGDDEGESETRMVAIKYDGLHIVNTYVPQGRDLDHEMFQFKLEWFRRLRAYMNTHYKNKKKKLVWVGDLNVAPTALDVHSPKRIWPHVCYCQDVLDAFADVTDFGFEDVFRKHLPEEGTFTYWDYRTKNALDRGIGWRIDHILATPPVAKTSQSVEIDYDARRKEKPSDHTFVTATFAL